MEIELDRPRVWIGDYSIQASTVDGMVWICHASGEGMQIPEQKLEDALHEFYKENF